MAPTPRLSRRRALAGLVTLGPLVGCANAPTGPGAVLAARPPSRPLLLDEPALARVRANVVADPAAREALALLRRRAGELAVEPLIRREFEPGRPVMLPTSRRALERVTLCAFLARLDGDARLAVRAREELKVVAAFPDWNPSHFLDVAEMAAAVALGIGWLGPALPAEERARLVATLQSHAVAPGLAAFRGRPAFWTAATHNWNLVCNGGLTLAALAVAPTAPDPARRLLDSCVESARLAFASYAPDGGWSEGPGYWGYATRYASLTCWALEQQLGGSFGLAETAGFARTADFLRHMTGPSGDVFNWGDGPERARPAGVAWLGARFGRPQDFALALESGATTDLVLALVAGARGGAAARPADLPLGARFAAVEAVSLRGAWNDPRATWFALKGGDNAANHADLDLGTFVLEADGERWAIDLGSDDYALPGYFGPERWRYYRKTTAGQNTLAIGAAQVATARAPVVAFRTGDTRRFAVVDLSAAYGHPPGRMLRGAIMSDNRDLVLQDDVAPEETREVVWQMHTRAAVALDGQRATLSQNGRTLSLRLLVPAAARFEAASARRAPPEGVNDGVTRLFVRLPAPARPAERRLAIAIEPGAGSSTEMWLEPLAQWVEVGRV